MNVATGQTTPWVNIDCVRSNLLSDDHIVYSESGDNGPLLITGGSAADNPPHDFHLDLSVLDSLPVESSDSLRIAEELIEIKGRHPSLDISGRFVGRSIVLLDMHTGTALLTVKVPMDSLTCAYALSRDGKKYQWPQPGELKALDRPLLKSSQRTASSAAILTLGNANVTGTAIRRPPARQSYRSLRTWDRLGCSLN